SPNPDSWRFGGHSIPLPGADARIDPRFHARHSPGDAGLVTVISHRAEQGSSCGVADRSCGGRVVGATKSFGTISLSDTRGCIPGSSGESHLPELFRAGARTVCLDLDHCGNLAGWSMG